MTRRLLHLLPLALAAWAAGCVTAPPKVAYTPEEMRAELVRRLGPERGRQLPIPFEVDPEIVEAAKRIAGPGLTVRDRFEGLAVAMASPDGLGLQYDADLTGTVRQTIERGRGDCLSLTALFVGLARAASLEAFFVDARGVQEFAVEGDLFVDRRHIVAGYGKPPQFSIVDFDRVLAPHVQYRILTDVQALARYYNNLGYDELRAGNNDAAAEHFAAAVALDDAFAPAHNNLALVLNRRGDHVAAERHLQAALQHDPLYSAAMINLANVYQAMGRQQEADALRRDSGRVKLRDPFWRLAAGLEAWKAGDFAAASRDLEASVKLEPRIPIAWFRLAQCHEALGNRQKALDAVEHVLKTNPGFEGAMQLKKRLTDAAPAARRTGG